MPATLPTLTLARRSHRRGPARAPEPSGSTNPALVLAIILGSYLMVVLDVSVIITALPKIHQTLHFSAAGLSWVQSAYALTFGGLLLLGALAHAVATAISGSALFLGLALLVSAVAVRPARARATVPSMADPVQG
jgi:MFS family permease